MLVSDSPAPDADAVRAFADMLTPDELRVIADAYAGARLGHFVALAARVTCHLCEIPTSLRDPSVPWPDCAAAHALAG